MEERLTDVEVRIRQLQARKQALAQQVKQQQRKERTRTLIQIGAILAKLGVDSLEKAQAFQKEIQGRPEAQDWLKKVTARAAQPTRTED
ncbi:MAG: hypothetical protein K0R39_1043 [Symbiobacteriaceae bacterium]|jgi:hypothetical protein|nr:hypothetical protein [Symbiobacteriaceae bacterium]